MPTDASAPLTAPLTARSVQFTLPLPDPLLTPNKRMHWAEKARHTREQRREAWAMARQVASEFDFSEFSGKIRLDVVVFPRPRMKRHDDDNFWAALKATRDGIADALGIVDSEFVIGSLTWNTARVDEMTVTLTAAG